MKFNAASGRSVVIFILICSLFGVCGLVLFLFTLVEAHFKGRHFLPGNDRETEILKVVNGIPSEGSCRASLLRYTEFTNKVGEEMDIVMAMRVRDDWEANGIPNVKIVEYESMLPFQLGHNEMELWQNDDKIYEFDLKEPELVFDGEDQEDVPTYNGWSAKGTIKGPITYVNYGQKEDFDYLLENGLNVNGTICLARYGKNYRGVKAMLAEEHGCLGLIIYSDPQDDGFVLGKVYPDGKFRPPTSVQRGAVSYLQYQAGDPTTVGWSSLPGSIDRTEDYSMYVPGILVQPISYGNAEKILEKLDGHAVPNSWVGGLKVDYKLGTAENSFHIKLMINQERKLGQMYNVMATIPGKIEPDRYIVLGNHRDAWTPGGSDPKSGTNAFTEVTKVLGELLSSGWQPRRTIILGSWDGEEAGLLGATEWVEDNSHYLRSGCVAYLNVDMIHGNDHLQVLAVPLFKKILYRLAKKIQMIDEPTTLYDNWKQNLKEPEIFPVGSGSDYTPFLQFLGISSLALEFNSKDDGPYPLYHSIYDNFDYISKWVDPGFKVCQTVSKFWALLAIELADQELLEFDLSAYVNSLQNDWEKILTSFHHQITDRDLLYQFDMVGLKLKKLESAVGEFNSTLHALEKLPEYERATQLRIANDKMIQFERSFIDQRGIHGREWYKHLIVAPGLYKGYGATTFPGIVETINYQPKNTRLLTIEAERIQRVLQNAISLLNGDFPSHSTL